MSDRTRKTFPTKDKKLKKRPRRTAGNTNQSGKLLMDLPQHVFFNVFTFLDHTRTLVRCLRVSKQFNQRIQTLDGRAVNLTFSVIHNESWRQRNIPQWSKGWVQHNTSSLISVEPENIKLAHSFMNLRHLECRLHDYNSSYDSKTTWCKRDTLHGLGLMPLLLRLESFDVFSNVPRGDFFDGFPEDFTCPHLKDLSIRGMNLCAPSLKRRFPALRTLDLGGLPHPVFKIGVDMDLVHMNIYGDISLQCVGVPFIRRFDAHAKWNSSKLCVMTGALRVDTLSVDHLLHSDLLAQYFHATTIQKQLDVHTSSYGGQQCPFEMALGAGRFLQLQDVRVRVLLESPNHTDASRPLEFTDTELAWMTGHALIGLEAHVYDCEEDRFEFIQATTSNTLQMSDEMRDNCNCRWSGD